MWRRPEKDLKNPPGQIVNRPNMERTLGDYVKNKYPEEVKKKLTFEEWFAIQYGRKTHSANPVDEAMRACWYVAQENK